MFSFSFSGMNVEFLVISAIAMIYGGLALSWQTKWFRDDVRGPNFGLLKALLDTLVSMVLESGGIFTIFVAFNPPSAWLGPIWLVAVSLPTFRLFWSLVKEPVYLFKTPKGAVRAIARSALSEKLPLLTQQGYVPTR